MKLGRVEQVDYSVCVLHAEIGTQFKTHWILWESFHAFLETLDKSLNEDLPRISFPYMIQMRVLRRGDSCLQGILHLRARERHDYRKKICTKCFANLILYQKSNFTTM